MDVSENHQIGLILQTLRVGPVHHQMSFLVGEQFSRVLPGKPFIKPPRQSARKQSEPLKKGSAFKDGFPASTGTEQVAVDQPNPYSLECEIVRLFENLGPYRPLIKRQEPKIMIPGHDLQSTATIPELDESHDSVTAEHLGFGGPGAHPEIAEVANDRQRITRSQACNEMDKATPSLGVI